MNRYCLNKDQLTAALKKAGHPSVYEFIKTKGFNRRTFYNYLHGQGGPIAEPFYDLCEKLNVDPLALLGPRSGQEQQDRIHNLASIIVKRDPRLAVGLFGSRAKGKPKTNSDWDIGITKGIAGLTTNEYLRFKVKVGDLVEDWPQSVDVINLDQAPAWFFKEMDYEPIFLTGNEQSWNFFLGVLNGAKRTDKV